MMRRQMEGFTLVEVLVSLVVLSVGLLGIAALYVESLKAGRTSLNRITAITLAADMADRIRANRDAGVAYAGVGPGADNDCVNGVAACTAAELAAEPGGFDRTWGEVRPVSIRHPLGGLPVLGDYLNMSTAPLPGWAGTVRAQTATYGASMRMVVSPGREESGLLHMPTGQSGHFMSPHYSDQHDAWVKGLPVPLLAGEPVDTLRLVPVSYE